MGEKKPDTEVSGFLRGFDLFQLGSRRSRLITRFNHIEGVIGEGLKLIVDVGVDHLNLDISLSHTFDRFLVEGLAHVVGLVLEGLYRGDDFSGDRLEDVVVYRTQCLSSHRGHFANTLGLVLGELVILVVFPYKMQ